MALMSIYHFFRNEKRCKNERLVLFIPVVSISRFRNTVTVSVFCTHTTSRPNKRPFTNPYYYYYLNTLNILRLKHTIRLEVDKTR